MRAATLLAGLWAGVMAGLAAIAAPAAFALLDRAVAGQLAGRLFAVEAYASLVVALLLFLLLRGPTRAEAARGEASVLSAEMLCILGALFCTVAGYFGLQPMMVAARAGEGALSFGALHGLSTAFYVAKSLLVFVLLWRLTGRLHRTGRAA